MFPAQLTESGREQTLQIAVMDQFWDVLQEGYERLIKWLKSTAPQLTSSTSFFPMFDNIKLVVKPFIPALTFKNSG
jgi:hypothetical protein